MPKRVLDGEGIWRSDKLKSIDHLIRAEYANLIPLADANGVFECDPTRIWSIVYSYNRPEITQEIVLSMLQELWDARLLYVWEEKAKKWGYFVGIEKPGRLPGPSRKGTHDATYGVVPERFSLNQHLNTSSACRLVYFIQGQTTKLIKIGTARYPRERLDHHQCGSPDRLDLLAVVPGLGTLEGDLHRRFQRHRTHGEWFNPDQEILEYIKSCASMDSVDYEDGIQKLPGFGSGFGFGIGIGKGIGGEAGAIEISSESEPEDQEMRRATKEIPLACRRILKVKPEGWESVLAEIKQLGLAHGQETVIQAFEDWANENVGDTFNGFPLAAFLKVADGIIGGVIQITKNPAQEALVDKLVYLSRGAVTFDAQQARQVAKLLNEATVEEVVLAFGEYFTRIEGDQIGVKLAAKKFPEQAMQLIRLARRNKQEAEQIQKQMAKIEGEIQEQARLTLEKIEKERLAEEELAKEGI